MFRSLFFLLVFLSVAASAMASVELSLQGQPPTIIEEVYVRDGVAYLAADDVLGRLGLSGAWDGVEHVFRIQAPAGTAVISPGSHYLRLGERFMPLPHPPRFLGGRLRISEDFVTGHLSSLVGQRIHYLNLDPRTESPAQDESPLDRLFAFLMRKEKPAGGPALRGIAIDPGHGGEDTGALGSGGGKEKTVALEVARRLEKQLKMQMEIPIYMSRDGDYSLNAQQRLEPAARPDADVLLQLHAQSSFKSSPRGVTLIVRPQEQTAQGSLPPGEGESIRLARSLADALRSSGIEVAGIIQAPLLPLGRGDLPTVLIELGYLSNPLDKAVLSDPSGQEKMAGALYAGLKNYADALKEVPR